jgi:hypothetical protein
VTPVTSGIQIMNKATYSGFVHGDQQSELHRRAGWLTLKNVAEEQLPILVRELIRLAKRGIEEGK